MMTNLIGTLTAKATVGAVVALIVAVGYVAAALLDLGTAIGALEAGFLIVLGWLFGRARPEGA